MGRSYKEQPPVKRSTRSARHQNQSGFNHVTGTYIPQSGPPQKKKHIAWPWILLTILAIVLVRSGFPPADAPAASQPRSAVSASTLSNSQAAGGTSAKAAPQATAAQGAGGTRKIASVTQIPTPVPTLAPAATTKTGYVLLKYGGKGAAVKEMQKALIALGYLAEGTADGEFGSGTRDAVKSFQKINGLTADGMAGDQTLALMYGKDAKPDPDPFVWVADKGKAYHDNPGCSNMKSPCQIKKSEAEKQKRTPCKKCY